LEQVPAADAATRLDRSQARSLQGAGSIFPKCRNRFSRNARPRHPRKQVTAVKQQNGKAEKNGKMKRKAYEKELKKLQVELCHLQEWVKQKGLRVIIAFEGRDAAGKGGTIKALTERVSPRVFRVMALPAPSDRQKSQMFLQRYVELFPAAGEIVIFDRSWYNRSGVERVMGFVDQAQYDRFLQLCPIVEKFIVEAGIILIKIWLEVGKEEQEKRFNARIEDPMRQWKLSPMDIESFPRWYAYSRARDAMLKATDTSYAPWVIVRSDDKRKGRLNCISHILGVIPYKKIKRPKVKLPKRSDKGRYDDQSVIATRRFVAERY
jgi:polyphosphate kinase 2